MIDDKLTEKIIGAAYTVFNTLGYGFLESVYEKSLCLELSLAGLEAEELKAIQVDYKGSNVGVFVPDLLVENSVIVELKSVSSIQKAHEVQLVNYLVATGIEIGLPVNFFPSGVVVKRKYRTPNT